MINGQICGNGIYDGQSRAFLMTPVSGSNAYTIVDLCGKVSTAVALNNSGQVVGWYPAASATIGVDSNRDGTIDYDGQDTTGSDSPFRFWVNDDRDVFVAGDQNDQEDVDPKQGQRDNANNRIAFERDLEDFSRLQIEAPAEFSPGSSWKCTVQFVEKTGSPGIRLFRAVSPDNKYLTDETTARQQIAATESWNISASEVEIPDSVFKPVGNKWSAAFIFEGMAAGKGALQVKFYKNGTEKVADDRVWLDLHNIKDFCDKYTLPEFDPNRRVPSSATAKAAQLTPETTDYILFVHGWRMQEWEKESFGETAFKRLWHRGYKGGFGLFSWPTEYTDNPVRDPGNYDRSERKAWNSAAALRGVLKNLNGQHQGKVRVLAHSMGNVVTSEALFQEAESATPQQIVSTYVASQAAVPAQAYNSDVMDNRPFPRKTYSGPNVYAKYPPTSRPYFQGTKGAAELKLAAANLVNFFNPDDYALSAWRRINQATKPDLGYSYISAVPFVTSGFFRNFTRLNIPQDKYEIFAHAAPAFSLALGAQSVGGPFSSNLNLKSTFGFTNKSSDHSAQFNSTLMKRKDYWDELLKTFDLK